MSRMDRYSRSRFGKRWTAFEVEEVAEMWREGGLVDEIAILIGRTHLAVLYAIGRLRSEGRI